MINVPNNLSNLRSKVDKLVPVPVDLGKLSYVIKMLKKIYIMLKLKMLKIQYLLLLT